MLLVDDDRYSPLAVIGDVGSRSSASRLLSSHSSNVNFNLVNNAKRLLGASQTGAIYVFLRASIPELY